MLSERARSAAIYAIAVVAAVVILYPAFDNSFRRDDFSFLHAVITQGMPQAAIEPNVYFPYWRPGAMALFYAEFRAFGFDGGLYIVLNFILHAINSLLLLLILRRLSFDWSTTALAASLFVVGVCHYGKQIMWACTSGPIFAVTLTLLVVWLTGLWLGVPGRAAPVPDRVAPRTAPGDALSGSAQGLPVTILLLLLVIPLFHEIGPVAPLLVPLYALVMFGWKALRRRSVIFVAAVPLVVWVIALGVISRTHPDYGGRVTVGIPTVDYLLRYVGIMLFPVQRPFDEASLNPGVFSNLIPIATPVHYVLAAAFVIAAVFVFIRGPRNLRFVMLWVVFALLPFSLLHQQGSWLELRYVYYAALPMTTVVAAAVVYVFRKRGTVWRGATAVVLIVALAGTVYLTRMLERKYQRFSSSTYNLQALEQLKEQWSERSGKPAQEPPD